MGITEGPWIVHDNEDSSGLARYEIQFGNDGECIAEWVHVKDDAYAIAAVPDLLQACKLSLALGLPHNEGLKKLEATGFDYSNRFELSATKFVENFAKKVIKKVDSAT